MHVAYHSEETENERRAGAPSRAIVNAPTLTAVTSARVPRIFEILRTWNEWNRICQRTSMMGQLLSINVGLPRDVAWRGEKVHTAIWKQPVQGRIAVRRLNVGAMDRGILPGMAANTGR